MKAGKIGIVEGDATSIDSFETTVTQGDVELSRCLEVRQEIELSDITIYEGRVATEQLTEVEKVSIEGGEIKRYEEKEKTGRYAEFVYAPAEFAVTDPGSEDFAFNILSKQTNINIQKSEININAFLRSHPSSNRWKVGFQREYGEAENGVIHGTDVLSDNEVGSILEESRKNQIGLEYAYDDEHRIKLLLTQSGYIDIYQPSNYDSQDFVKYLRDEIVDYASSG